ncbi:hypothetical protein SLS62_006915 [Diatrype stigma]|uniref:Nucleoporin NUP53 n=1 Tax=Diatrype stigma TaxID=117547 RepID=A0AAN9YNP2_9PEZI
MEHHRSDRQPSAPRTRRAVAETGSFGKSTRRSRSRTGSAPPKREDANMKVADDLFSKFLAGGPKKATDEDDHNSNHHHLLNNNASAAAAAPSKRKTSYLNQTVTASAQDALIDDDDATSALPQPPRFQKEPTEVILRGYASPDQQYAAVNHYEQVAGRICEDYAREPPPGARRYKSELRDPALTRRQAPTRAERLKVAKVAGGEHWIKVTFESADAADAAVWASPQRILGHLVYAELYHGLPPKEDAAVVDLLGGDAGMLDPATATAAAATGRRGGLNNRRHPGQFGRNGGGGAKSWASGAAATAAANGGSPPGSQTSTGTLDTATASTATVTGAQAPEVITSTTTSTATTTSTSAANNGTSSNSDSAYCSVIPTARRVKLLPADQAMAPQPSPMQQLVARIPLIGWFSGSMIGNEVPRTEVGEFDLARASLFWRLMFYLDLWFGLFGSDLVSGDKED